VQLVTREGWVKKVHNRISMRLKNLLCSLEEMTMDCNAPERDCFVLVKAQTIRKAEIRWKISGVYSSAW